MEQSLNGICWEERVDYLESMIGDSADHHRKAFCSSTVFTGNKLNSLSSRDWHLISFN